MQKLRIGVNFIKHCKSDPQDGKKTFHVTYGFSKVHVTKLIEKLEEESGAQNVHEIIEEQQRK